jgi:hypothetical protein
VRGDPVKVPGAVGRSPAYAGQDDATPKLEILDPPAGVAAGDPVFFLEVVVAKGLPRSSEVNQDLPAGHPSWVPRPGVGG